MSIDVRRLARPVLVVMAAVGCLLLPSRQTASVALGWASLFEPVERAAARAGRAAGFALDDIISWRRVAANNRALRAKVHELTELLERERAASAEKTRQLEAIAEFLRHHKDRTGAEVVEDAEVIGEGIGAQRGIVFIDRGSRHRIEPGMAIVVGNSIIGTVSAVSVSMSSVVLVTSPGSVLDGQVTGTGERGLVCGLGDGTMRMKYISRAAPSINDAVMTSGRDGLVPRQFLLGRVTAVSRKPGSLTYDVTLRPVRDGSDIARVLVVRRYPPTELPSETAKGRTAGE